MRILIADDEAIISDSLSRLLGYLGHEVEVAPDPASTLARIQEARHDVLLLDWLMPDGGGKRVLQALSHGSAPAPRVVLMTGSPDESLPEAGSMPVLHKPFRLQALRDTLAGLVATPPRSA